MLPALTLHMITHSLVPGKPLQPELPTGPSCATLRTMAGEKRICSYEDSEYRTDFWEGQGREYEDLAERIALRRLLPQGGRRLIDVGAGFGRLSEFYDRFDQVVLLDYSRSLLQEAQVRLGRDSRYVYVAASFYAMPFAPGSFDTAMMVRVMHHVEDVPSLLAEMARVLVGDGTYVLEHANKLNLKAILRYLIRRQDWSPFTPEPYEFVTMNYDFHPDWMRRQLDEAGFHVKRTLTTSHFRLPLLKRMFPAPFLATMDAFCQPTGAWWQLTPSVFLQSSLDKPGGKVPDRLRFQCPVCSSQELIESPTALHCQSCGRGWPVEDGILSFKEPRPA
jgi:ubiquinone/menaquinone biosynthesis C-methylase UbiE